YETDWSVRFSSPGSAPLSLPEVVAMRHPRWSPVVLLVLLLGLGCGRSPQQKGEVPPTKVEVDHPVIRPVTDYEEYTGRTDAVRSVDLKAQVTGILEEALFKEGDSVQENQLLFRIDDRPFTADLKRAQADVTKARAQIKLSEARRVQLTAQLARARKLSLAAGPI